MDEGDCEHDWQPTEIGARGTGSKGLDVAETCTGCGAVSYVPAPDPATRPPL